MGRSKHPLYIYQWWMLPPLMLLALGEGHIFKRLVTPYHVSHTWWHDIIPLNILGPSWSHLWTKLKQHVGTEYLILHSVPSIDIYTVHRHCIGLWIICQLRWHIGNVYKQIQRDKHNCVYISQPILVFVFILNHILQTEACLHVSNVTRLSKWYLHTVISQLTFQ